MTGSDQAVPGYEPAARKGVECRLGGSILKIAFQKKKASTYFILCTRFCNMYTYHVKEPSALTAACSVSIGPIPEFRAIDTNETATGH